MSRILILAAFAFLSITHVGDAYAQTKQQRMDQATQKMKTSEDPSSPEMQQAAAKQVGCKKEAKAKGLKGSDRKSFMKECVK
jgi:hypothetical protein